MQPDASQLAVIGAPTETSGVVIGAPGTGKTATVMARIESLIQSGDCAADEVLAITPSRQTATAMRDRIGVRLAVATPGALARSVGSFAFQLVAAHAAAQGEEAPSLLTGAEQDRIITDLLASAQNDFWPEQFTGVLRSSATFRAELREFLAECTRYGIGENELRASDDPRWQAVAKFLASYNSVMAQMLPGRRETAELLREAANIVRSGHELGPFKNLRTVIVDDAQELTRGGLDLVLALNERGVAVLAFGDPDIASGTFRGASPELFNELVAKLGEVFVLKTGHRTTQAVRAVTDRLTQAIGAASRVDHRMPQGEPDGVEDSVRVVLATSPHEEFDLIAATLRKWQLTSAAEWDSFAVIAHDSSQVAQLEAELAAREVPTRAAGVQRPLGGETVVREIAEIVLLGLSEPEAREAAALESALLSRFGGLDSVSLRRLRARLRHEELAQSGARPASELLQEAMAQPASLTLIETPEARAAEHFADTLRLVHEASDRSAHELLWLVWDRARDISGRSLATTLKQTNADRELDALVSLFTAAKRAGERAHTEPASVFLNEVLQSAVPEDSLAAAARTKTVQVMTPAAALGTEFDRVIIAGLQDGTWPNVRLRGSLFSPWAIRERFSSGGATDTIDRRRIALHDEMRLFVRAISRARSHVLVTAVRDDDLIPSSFFALLPDATDSVSVTGGHPLTLRGTVAKLRRVLTTATSAAESNAAAEQLAILAREGVAGADPQQWYGMLAPSSTAPLTDLQERAVRVSPSRIESFEKCALNWVVAELGGKVSTSAAGLGTVIHAAMEDVPYGGLEELSAAVAARWGDLEFESYWVEQGEKRRVEVLIDRLNHYLIDVAKQGGKVVGSESRFEIEIQLDADGGRALLTGVIDRVEIYPPDPDSTVSKAVIADLKTGKATDRDSNEKVKDDAQLSAYQLAFKHGGVPQADGAELESARLVLIGANPLKGKHYRIPQQSPMSEEESQAFVERVSDAARGMAGSAFLAYVETHCLEDDYAVCRIHTIGAVSSA